MRYEYENEVYTMKILVTAFEPFGGDSTNSSLNALSALPDTMDGITIWKATIPVVFEKCGVVLAEKIRETTPDGVLCLGMAAGRGQITPEVFAVNARFAVSADNAGVRYPTLTPCDPTGPAAYRTGLPVETIVENLRAAGIPAGLSFTAGTYVCNDLFYSLMQQTTASDRTVPAGFIHVPQAAENTPAGRASMPQEQIDRGVQLALSTLCAAIHK